MEKLYIKNMVCDRCISSVKHTFQKQKIPYTKVVLGEVDVSRKLSSMEMAELESQLRTDGFEIIDSTSPVIVNQIKSALISLFQDDEVAEDFRLSSYLTSKLPYDYSHLSRVFSHHEQETIEHYMINLRIEKAKEMLTYRNLNISEVAYRLGYLSSAHFSRQFKKVVGVTPSRYTENPFDRKSLEEI